VSYPFGGEVNNDLVTFTVLALIGLLVSGFISYAVLFKPELGDKLISLGKTRLSPWTLGENGDLYLKALVLVVFLVSLGINCLVFYGWLARFSAR
jgi:hypothetical protein